MTIEEYIDAHTDEMLEDLKTLVRIRSMRGEAKPGMPFGEGPARALAAAQKMMDGYGFLTKNYDNYVVIGDFSEQEKGLDILAHLDVVPVTPDWKVTEPFEPRILDGRIYGRGTADDKGPAIAALYAMRAVKECGIGLRKNVRLILGADEECGSGDLEHYYQIEQEAPASFTPDADFPLINLEKGRLEQAFTAEFNEAAAEPCVLELHGGDKANVVPGNAWATLAGLSRETIEREIAADDSGVRFTLEEDGRNIKIFAKGAAAHASLPENGKNAVCALLALVGRLPLAASGQTAALRAVAELYPYGDTEGRALGVAMRDDLSGALTMNLGILDFDGKTLQGVSDGRIPMCGSDGNVTEVICARMLEKGLVPEENKMAPPHYVPADSPLVQTLLDCYEKYSGVRGKPLAIGGGTYVHELEHGVAFGCMREGVDNHMHGDDEFMEIQTMVMSAKIFAEAICRICG